MILPTLPNKYVLLGAGLILAFGFTFSYGYYKGGEQAEERFNERLLEANEKLLESEKALARVASRKASEDAQRLTQAVSDGNELRRQYEDAKPHEVDPVNCVSDEQRRVLSELARSTQ
jgi:hypothetical protein